MSILDYVEKYAPEHYMDWHLKISRYLAVLPPENLAGRTCYYFLQLLSIIFIVSEFIQMCSSSNFTEIVLIMGQLSVGLMSTSKVLFFWLFGEKIAVSFDIIQRKSFNFDNYNTNLNFELYQKNLATIGIDSYADLKKAVQCVKIHHKNESDEVETYRKEKISKITTLCYMITVFFINWPIWNVVIIYGGTFIHIISGLKGDNDTKVELELPFKQYVPYDIVGTVFWCTLFMQFFYFNYMMTCDILIHISTVNALLLLTTQVRVIIRALKYVDVNHQSCEGMNLELNRRVKFVRCHEQLQEILRAAEILEDLTNPLLAIHYSLAAIFVTGCIFVSLEVQSKVQFFALVSVAMGLMTEVTLTSLTGQLLTTECENVLFAMYDLNWTDYGTSLKKEIIFAMSRFDKPVGLTLGKTIALNPEFATSFLRTMYSLLTLITQMKN